MRDLTRADFYDNIREGGHLPEHLDFDELADEIQADCCDECKVRVCDACDIGNPKGSR